MATVTGVEFGFFFLLFLQFFATISGNFTDTHWQHKCDPGSEIFACTVPNFLYKPNKNHSSLVVTGPVRKVRLAYPRDKRVVHAEIFAYDAVLHEALQRPQAVQIVDGSINTVELPFDLEYADFNDNEIVTLSAPASPDSTYALRYLNLRYNRISTIGNEFSALVNLETLLLQNNHISVVDGSVLKKFTKLSGLHLGGNYMEAFPLADLPASLEWLSLRQNEFRSSLDFTDMYTPALKVLDLHGNYFKSMDIGPLLTAAPNLSELALKNDFQLMDGAAEIAEKLKEAGIAHDRFNLVDPDYDDGYGDEDDEDHDNDDYDNDGYNFFDTRHLEREKHEAREYVFAGLLTVLNLGVIAWGGYVLYKERFDKK